MTCFASLRLAGAGTILAAAFACAAPALPAAGGFPAAPRGGVASGADGVSVSADPPAPSNEVIERRAFDFFWEQTDPATGLTRDRAANSGYGADSRAVASIAATGYSLAALPIAVEHGWVSREGAYNRALTTLRFVHDRLPQNHGFSYHFVDCRTGYRVWNCELSTIDTALLALGGEVAASYWPNTDVSQLADGIAARIDWRWAVAEGGKTPAAFAPTMGWTPEHGWIAARWQGYSEACFLYLLALGTPSSHGLSASSWDHWQTPRVKRDGWQVFGGPSPLFMAQMAAGFFDLRFQRDRQGRDWWSAWGAAHEEDRTYCAAHALHASYRAGYWGLSASDSPTGYGVEAPADGRNDGTVSPPAMLAAATFLPTETDLARTGLWKLRAHIWGRYGYSDAFNQDKNWYDSDVIGIDLGIELLGLENSRSGAVWRWMALSPFAQRGLRAAGFHSALAPPAAPAKSFYTEVPALTAPGSCPAPVAH